MTTGEAQQVRGLKRKVAELEATRLSPGRATPAAVIVRFIDSFRHVFGVQAICRALSAHHVPMVTRMY